MKPGYKTTEFWLTVIAAFGGVFVAFGFVDQSDVDNVIKSIGALVGAAVALFVAVKPIIEYIKSRTAIKDKLIQ